MTPPQLRGRVDAIVIGASAGGVEALSVLLPALKAGAPVAVFVVIHLPRDARSLMAEIFAPRCALEVREAIDKEEVRASTVYFAPPDYHLLIDAGPSGPALALSIDEPVHFSRPSIDVLFESAADAFGQRLLGVVLTGGNEDGAAGLAAVARRGGLTMVQAPHTANAALMPEAALKAVDPDFVGTLDAMADAFATLEGPDA